MYVISKQSMPAHQILYLRSKEAIFLCPYLKPMPNHTAAKAL